eukprot:762813-Hanusia_phi.AAC.1
MAGVEWEMSGGRNEAAARRERGRNGQETAGNGNVDSGIEEIERLEKKYVGGDDGGEAMGESFSLLLTTIIRKPSSHPLRLLRPGPGPGPGTHCFKPGIRHDDHRLVHCRDFDTRRIIPRL